MADITQPQQNTQLDPSIVNLARAISKTETAGSKSPYSAKGGSGEYGAYQYTEPTWNADSQKYLGQQVPLAQSTPEQQDKVAYYKIQDLGKQGYKPNQIASIWNSGKPDPTGNVGTNKSGVHYDTPQYVQSVGKVYEQLQGGQEATPEPTASTVGAKPQVQTTPDPSNTTNAPFPAQEGDTGATAGLKALGNLVPSAYNFGKGLVKSVTDVPGEIAQIPQAIKDAYHANNDDVGQTLKSVAETAPSSILSVLGGLVPQGVKQAVTGDFKGAGKSFTNDPFGQAAPIVLAAEGGAKLADSATGGTGFSNAFSKGVETIAKPVTAPISALGDITGKIAKYGIGKTTGLNPETINQIIENPKDFTKQGMEGTSRTGVAGQVMDSIDKIIADKSETGSGYDVIRKSSEGVRIPSGADGIQSVLNKFGITLDENGQIKTSAESTPLSGGDKAAIQNFIDQYGKEPILSGNGFLNTRAALDNMSKWDASKTNASTAISRSIRNFYDTQGKSQLKGLSDLDKEYAPQAEQYKQLRKDLIDKDGNFKDGAINKIANATGKGKDNLLARLEEITPGITKKIKVMKAVEDIEATKGNKVGTYTKSIIGSGGLLSGLATGNLPLALGSIAEMIITNPDIATSLIRKYGLTKAQITNVANIIRTKLNGGGSKPSFPTSALGLTANQNR